MPIEVVLDTLQFPKPPKRDNDGHIIPGLADAKLSISGVGDFSDAGTISLAVNDIPFTELADIKPALREKVKAFLHEFENALAGL